MILNWWKELIVWLSYVKINRKKGNWKLKFRTDMQSKIINKSCRSFCSVLWKPWRNIHCNHHIGLRCRSNISIFSHLGKGLDSQHCRLWKSIEMFQNQVCSWLLYCKLTIGWRASKQLEIKQIIIMISFLFTTLYIIINCYVLENSPWQILFRSTLCHSCRLSNFLVFLQNRAACWVNVQVREQMSVITKVIWLDI